MSDHGCHFKTRNWEYKRSCHDSSIHIPLIIKGLDFLGGKEIDKMVNTLDITPTILRAAGVEVPKQMKGQPLQLLLNEDYENWPEEVFIQISESQVGRAIRTKNWKYSIRAPRKSGFLFMNSNKYREDCLYNLEDDPFEHQNLVEDPSYNDVRKKLRKLIKNYMKIAGENVPEIKPHKL